MKQTNYIMKVDKCFDIFQQVHYEQNYSDFDYVLSTDGLGFSAKLSPF